MLQKFNFVLSYVIVKFQTIIESLQKSHASKINLARSNRKSHRKLQNLSELKPFHIMTLNFSSYHVHSHNEKLQRQLNASCGKHDAILMLHPVIDDDVNVCDRKMLNCRNFTTYDRVFTPIERFVCAVICCHFVCPLPFIWF